MCFLSASVAGRTFALLPSPRTQKQSLEVSMAETVSPNLWSFKADGALDESTTLFRTNADLS